MRPIGMAATLDRGQNRKLNSVQAVSADAPIDPPPLGDRLEQVGLAANRLGRAQHQKTSRAQRKCNSGITRC